MKWYLKALKKYATLFSMFFCSKNKFPLLTVKVNNEELCSIYSYDLSFWEEIFKLRLTKKFSILCDKGAQVEFHTKEAHYLHVLAEEEGWLHFAIEVYIYKQQIVCQPVCAMKPYPIYHWEKKPSNDTCFIRFQPFMAAGYPQDLVGRGLFLRGLHYRGFVTPTNVKLSCICDNCKKSVHSGFSMASYFYSASGQYTLIVSDYLGKLSSSHPDELTKFEN
jgi:hypothetical protein